MQVKKMGNKFMGPKGYPNISGYRLVDMFTRVLTTAKKVEVIASFSESGGKLRLVIATTAFGMGIDCPDIRQIIHWGFPATLEEYVGRSEAAAAVQSWGGEIVYTTYTLAEPRPPPRRRGSARLIRTCMHYAI